ncbi:class I SAM-dependent methyltransferase [Corticibacter populi]|uniref:Class I SAM-dependent methyltransferase n=1 Tax=Corticibacter populi TaxID=1550736 RepID=A0A3M6QRS2_9BURK|nr:class I SAM-dependent methyltransferase [Corticibacter populi]RMX05737.1 class I SAM-dependent methyltransferase [Corticibacter populi]RZS30964.1 O-methyltransferase involved in polyketide biosynthesis [Corticibacter populi]
MTQEETQVALSAIPETMLWTLHNRACESMRADAMFHDPHAERIYRSIRYDYRRHFGEPDSSHAVRALMFDEVMGHWLARHPGSTVVELGCGLETQCLRLDDGRVQWLSVDVPEAMAVRERFIRPQGRLRHWHGCALEGGWMALVDADKPVFVSAQGLLMYFTEEQVRGLLGAIMARFPGVEMMFDIVPLWAVRLTNSPGGLWKTSHYRVPPMHWGIGGHAVGPLLKRWFPQIAEVRWLPYRHYRPMPDWYLQWLQAMPWTHEQLPGMVHVRT